MATDRSARARRNRFADGGATHGPDVEDPRSPSGGLVIRGDWPALVQLFARATPLSMSHWNPQTGELFELPRGKQRASTAERFEQRLWHEPHWVEVPCQESDGAYQMTSQFVAELRPGRGRHELASALQGPKPFRAVRVVLERHPGLKRRWQAVVEQEATMRLTEFCLSQSWRLEDARFEAAVERWLDATEEEATQELGGRAPGLLVQVAEPAARRSVASLSIGGIVRGPNRHGTVDQPPPPAPPELPQALPSRLPGSNGRS